MRIIHYHENSLSDFQSGLDYYDGISPSIGDRFEKDFWETIEKIKINPFHFQVKYFEVRVAFLQHFPFSIHFLANEKEIEVLTVLHNSRNY
ncbi:hypothetical protein H0S70_10250 [Chryseobacterium manosquense]|uniref:Type II toxin-antitoxin system RelE/ParE family toxin n=1 Tax=Chryseobacterium manosquense TaxID=2754694 RepID=A0A7H1DUT1_9FLAO|nr:hypothetical protein [Chryseobacterium manosquense]QNS40739.1 hypothetical protein H0S70_10250 [Chryseobacterium manosquense]